jgi:hypothetical protein
MAREDEEDERPIKKKPSRPADDDEEYEEEERPRKKREKTSSGGGIIPLKNGQALAAYYCGVFSLIPFLGCILGPIAIILGILGFLFANKNPEAGGKGHAITGIILGLFGPFLIGGIFAILSLFMNR